jgi:hypothetical protein
MHCNLLILDRISGNVELLEQTIAQLLQLKERLRYLHDQLQARGARLSLVSAGARRSIDFIDQTIANRTSIPPDFFCRAFLGIGEMWGLLPVDLYSGVLLDCNDLFASCVKRERSQMLLQPLMSLGPDYVPMGVWIVMFVKQFGAMKVCNLPIFDRGEVHDVVWTLEYFPESANGLESSSHTSLGTPLERRAKCLHLLGLRHRAMTPASPRMSVETVDGKWRWEFPMDSSSPVHGLPAPAPGVSAMDVVEVDDTADAVGEALGVPDASAVPADTQPRVTFFRMDPDG